ncbi:MAG TPA: hypothetical protein VFI84_02535 [Candidatus Saccharimonadales bacterium]|nr:hypothetical protein [Candidatus Saccharimonadales bacterium]
MRKVVWWLVVTGVITITFGTLYVGLQQALRLGANDPQMQLAQDTASQLNKGGFPTQVVTGDVDIAHSAAPFTIIYDKSGTPIASSGSLNERVPKIPFGVLKASEGKPYHFVTWQPQPGIRLASVTVAAKSYYVTSARSLYETEQRTSTLGKVVLTGWLLSLCLIGVAAYWYGAKS